MRMEFDEWRANLSRDGHSFSTSDKNTLYRWWGEGLTIQGATIYMRDRWKSKSGQGGVVDYTLECLSADYDDEDRRAYEEEKNDRPEY